MECAVLLECPDEFRREAAYTFDQIFTILGVSHSFVSSLDEAAEAGLLVYYGPRPGRVRSSAPVLTIPFSPEPFDPHDEFVEYCPERVLRDGTNHLSFDLVKTAFKLLSRREEMEELGRDRFGRFPANQSSAYRKGLLNRPVVNEHLLRLLHLIRSSGACLLRKDFWPPKRTFAVCLSHDLDFKRKWGFRKLFLEARKCLRAPSPWRGLGTLPSSIASAGREDPYWNIDRLVEMERQFGFKSSFLFSSGRTAKWDPTYSLSERRIREALRTIESQGFEVALHGSFNSSFEPHCLAAEKRKLEKVLGRPVLGNRFHYLRLEIPRSWREEEEAGLSYDMTLGYPDRLGFRAGIAFPYNPYDSLIKRQFNILELPLTVSDGALLSETEDGAAEALFQLLSSVKENSGLLGLLWHPHTFDHEDFPSLRGIYPTILKWIRTNEGFAAPGAEICDWWLGRSGFRLVEKGRKYWNLLADRDLERMGLELIGVRGPNPRVEGCGLRALHKTDYGCYVELTGISRGKEIVVSLVR